MSSLHTLVEPIVGVTATLFAGVLASAGDLIEPKEVGLLTIVVGIGAWIVRSIDKTTDAVKLLTTSQAEANKETALLRQAIDESRRDHEHMGQSIIAGIREIPNHVASLIRGEK